jgi:hypothetical protein
MTGFPAVTSATVFWIDHEYDQANSSDGISRYGAYIRQRIRTVFAECWSATGDDSGRERFAAAAWRTATTPVMVPGYVRRHPRITAAQVERNDWDGSLTGIVYLIIPWPDALASSREWQRGQWWRDWPAEPSFGTGRDVYTEPTGQDLTKHPYLMASATLAFPLHPPVLPAAPTGPRDELEGKARRAVAALVTELNHVITPVISALERS